MTFAKFDLRFSYKKILFCSDFGSLEFDKYKYRNQKGVINYGSNYNSIEVDYTESKDPYQSNDGANSIQKRFIGERIL